jgi:hypothetical protein
MGVIGTYNDMYLIKYGLSSRVLDRDVIEHRQTFGDQFKMVHVIETDNNKTVEDIIKQYVKTLNIDVKMVFNGKMRTEMFIATHEFTIEKAIQFINDTVNDHPLPSNKERDDKIKELKYTRDSDILIEQERTKQMEIMIIKIYFLFTKK